MTFTDSYTYVAIQLYRFRRKEKKLKSLLEFSLAVLKSCGFQSGQGILSQQHSYRNNKTTVNNLWMQEPKAKISFVQSKFMVPHAPGFIIYALERKRRRRKTSIAQANAKVTFHTITNLWVASDLSTLYSKLMTFRIHREGLHTIMDLFL